MGLKSWLARRGGPGKMARHVASLYHQLIATDPSMKRQAIIASVEEACGIPGYNGMDLACSANMASAELIGQDPMTLSENDRDLMRKVIAEELRRAGVPDEISGARTWVDDSPSLDVLKSDEERKQEGVSFAETCFQTVLLEGKLVEASKVEAHFKDKYPEDPDTRMIGFRRRMTDYKNTDEVGSLLLHDGEEVYVHADGLDKARSHFEEAGILLDEERAVEQRITAIYEQIMGPLMDSFVESDKRNTMTPSDEFYFIRMFAFAIVEVEKAMGKVPQFARQEGEYFPDFVEKFRYVGVNHDQLELDTQWLDYMAAMLDHIPISLKDLDREGNDRKCHETLKWFQAGISQRCEQLQHELGWTDS